MRTNRVLQFLTCAAAMLPLSAFGMGVIANGSFEMDDTVAGLTLPAGFGDWEGDRATIVVAEQQITPFDGTRMLRFDSADSAGAAAMVADVIQLVDVSAMTGLIASGSASFIASAWYNRVPSDDVTDTEFGMSIQAMSGSAADYPTATPLASQSIWQLTDELTATWEEITLSMTLPAGTTYIAVLLHARENVDIDDFFHGHYVDAVSTRVVPLPAAFPLLAGALMLLGATGKRRR